MYTCVFYLYAYQHAPDGSGCDLPQVSSVFLHMVKGERMIKLFFLVKHKTRWKEPGFKKGGHGVRMTWYPLNGSWIFQNKKCGKSHLCLSKVVDTLLHGKILMKQKKMWVNRWHERWGRTDQWERAEEEKEKRVKKQNTVSSSRVNFRTSANNIFIKYLRI